MYMGIDIGTSAVKAVVIDDSGAVADQASAPLSVSRPHPLWSEQNPADWWSATNIAVSDVAQSGACRRLVRSDARRNAARSEASGIASRHIVE
jgi:xylulokinase